MTSVQHTESRRFEPARAFSYVFVQQLESREQIGTIESRLEECSKSNLPPLGQINKNALAVIRFGPRSRLRRVLVLDHKGKMANVAFVDFGNIDEVPAHLLRQLPADLLKIPALAIPLKLENAPANSDQRILFDDFLRSVVGLKARVELHNGTTKSRLKGSLQVFDKTGDLHSLEEIVTWKNTSFWSQIAEHRFNKYTVALPTSSTGHSDHPAQIAQNSQLSTDLYVVTHLVYLLVIAAAVGAIALLYTKIQRTKQTIQRSLQLIEFDNAAHRELRLGKSFLL